MSDRPCTSGRCVLCERDVACVDWHESADHGMPLLFRMTPEEAADELHRHMGAVWDSVVRVATATDKSPLTGTNERDLRFLISTDGES
ncbi:hypothetical protein SAMN05445060_2769 [Williamsia sterculiae]|uniref:Uncharacterized protein n=1 Tax=Williamsia sterculiae TaxID=1344003 RepID=A0A1N7GGU9_9NOCA|nr:hypothetical protein SAMN05445060_2769 [Williamsia sterculiae]